MKYRGLASIVGALCLTACGGAAAPTEPLTAAEASARAAEVGGAENHPKAALHLKYARDQIKQAKKLMSDNENERAAMVLQRASVDAELALAMARERQARTEADEAIEDIAELKEKMGNESTETTDKVEIE